MFFPLSFPITSSKMAPITPTAWVLLACVMQQTQDVYDIEISCLSDSIPEKYREKRKKERLLQNTSQRVRPAKRCRRLLLFAR